MTDHANLANQFAEAIAGTTLAPLIDRIEATDYGVKYLWDGFMQCHIIPTPNGLVDVADKNEPPSEGLDRYLVHSDVSAIVRHLGGIADDD